MKKKAILFFAFALLFIAAGFSGNLSSPSAIIATLICFLLGALFAFLGWRSLSSCKNPDDAPQVVGLHNTPPHTNYVTTSESDDYNCEFVNITLAGVSFQNDDGTDRQTLLRMLHFHDAPFDGNINVSVKESSFNGEIAFPVLVNDLLVGFIPKSQISYINENFDRIIDVSNIKVYGGGKDKNGKSISYGASIALKLRAD